MNKKLIAVLGFQLFLLLSVIKPDAMLWWDECTQLLLAKTALQKPSQFHDYGVEGWHVESGKAHLFPWLLALFGADPARGIILNAILSLVVSFLVFKITEREFGETTALLSVLVMLSFVDPFLLYSVKLYNHMTAMTTSLLAVYFAQRGRTLASSATFGLSMISRYDAWVTAVPVAYLLVKNSPVDWKKSLGTLFLVSSAVASLQFVVSDILEFGRPFASFAYEKSVFAGMAPSSEPSYYLLRFLQINPLSAFFLPVGVFLAWKSGKNQFLTWLLPALVFFEVLTPFKHLRFLISLLPILSPLAAFGLVSVAKRTGWRAMPAILVLFSSYNAYLAVSQMDFAASALHDDIWIRDVADFVGNKSVLTNYFSPLACYSGAKIQVLPPDKTQFQKTNFDYLLVLSGSFKPDYLADAISGLEKAGYRKRTINGTSYEYGNLDLYVRPRPSASP